MKLAIPLLLLPALALAEPSPAMRWLLDEPATLMDVGLLRLAHKLHEATGYLTDSYGGSANVSSLDIDLNTSIDYSLSTDTIQAHIFVSVYPTDGAEIGCRRLIQVTKRLLPDEVRSSFMHAGNAGATRPDGFADTLVAKTEVNCRVEDSTLYATVFAAQANLSDETVTVTQEYGEAEPE